MISFVFTSACGGQTEFIISYYQRNTNRGKYEKYFKKIGHTEGSGKKFYYFL